MEITAKDITKGNMMRQLTSSTLHHNCLTEGFYRFTCSFCSFLFLSVSSWIPTVGDFSVVDFCVDKECFNRQNEAVQCVDEQQK